MDLDFGLKVYDLFFSLCERLLKLFIQVLHIARLSLMLNLQLAFVNPHSLVLLLQARNLVLQAIEQRDCLVRAELLL